MEENILMADLASAEVPQPVHMLEEKKKVHKKPPTKAQIDEQKEKEQLEKKFFKRLSPAELRAMSIPERQRYYAWCADRDAEPVTGVFRFYERPGGEIEFEFQEHKGRPYKTKLYDGQTHTIPLGVARHLNKNGWYPEYEYIPGGRNILVPGGLPTNMRIGKKVRRFSFQKLDYMEEDMNEYGEPVSGLVEVEFVGNQNLVR